MAGYDARRQRSLARLPVDLRPILAPAIDQGTRPLCIPIVVTAAHEASRTQPPEPLAPDALWSSCVANGTASREGTTLESVADALRTDGQPSSAAWPFNTAILHEADQIPLAAQTSIWHQADLFSVPVANDGIEDDIEDQLAIGLVVALIIEVTTEFEQATPQWHHRSASVDGTAGFLPRRVGGRSSNSRSGPNSAGTQQLGTRMGSRRLRVAAIGTTSSRSGHVLARLTSRASLAAHNRAHGGPTPDDERITHPCGIPAPIPANRSLPADGRQRKRRAAGSATRTRR